MTQSRTFNYTPLIILGLVALSVLLFAALVMSKSGSTVGTNTQEQSQHQSSYRWRMVTTWPKNFPGLGTGAETFARLVNEMSNGRLTIHVHGAGEIVPAMGVFDAVSSGSVEMGHSGAYYWRGKSPATQFFTTVPFGMNAQEMNAWLYHGGGMELWREVYAPFNLIPFPAGSTGIQMGGWFNKEINTLDDLSGLKMRIPGLAGEVFNRAGGTSVNIPGGELYTALQTGVIDAAEWVGPANDMAFGFHEIAQYYYYPGWHEPGSMMELIINKDAYNSLPADLQAIVANAIRAASADMLDHYTATNNAALQSLINNHGIELKRFPDEVLQELRQMTEEVFQEQAAADPMFAKVYQSYQDFLTKAGQWHKVSEETFYQVRRNTAPE
ncbi:TRAP transporter substrate-binding protein [Gilvimarinus agarilyticus]|uniref:TRAP transporter substrate-binding protein n=1 Tax=unclassified Gilvimarinus TaxID=2642066 RepID=UPI001C087207|nr:MULTISPECIES: TRAP transporter substrate-binding protein [unclassified Gilvimarinus]MBU2886323.1 TRAP transporter substrate-binding protein [Gilvimarinus agarilyticus]MDO6571009.1 TRAP transporter substrate-binding protein [Gilvimarinus sp. 2_MG-2023]MDO6747861.1 TRAP transporter substrate-binding protein [Gilvimarinus sp. 1_MG-2023]